MIAQVYVNTKNLNIDKPFDYLVPHNLEDKIAVGCRVKIPFGTGNMPKEAYVTELKNVNSFELLKEIKSLTDELPVLTKSSIGLCFYMRERYFCTFPKRHSYAFRREPMQSLRNGFCLLTNILICFPLLKE